MAIHLYVAPAGAGKTAYCVDCVRATARAHPLAPVWVCLPNSGQVAAFRRRLAAAGGAIGVEAGSFFDLYREALRATGQVLAELEEPLQHRLVRAVVDAAAERSELAHYLPLRDKPGFVRVLLGLFRELKRSRVEPASFFAAVQGQGPRLEELATLYGAYSEWLFREGWMDREGLGWLAALALERDGAAFSGCPLAVVDGFDEFNPTQIAFLSRLGAQVPQVVLTLTGSTGQERLAHRRFARALARLEEGLGVRAVALPHAASHPLPGLAHLEAGLFEPQAAPAEPNGAVAWLEAPNRAAEVCAVLRWVKERLVDDEEPCTGVAILARDLTSYVPLLLETAEEYGLPLSLAGGPPLQSNPAVAALLNLVSLPRRDRDGALVPDGRFPARRLLDALRSPYFDWRDIVVDGEPLGLSLADVDLLEEAAGAAQVLAGPEQWREALALRLAQEAPPQEAEDADEAPPSEAPVPPQAAWAGLACRFERLLRRLTPPPEAPMSAYVSFVEDLIGDEPGVARAERAGLQVLAGIRDGPPSLVERDLEALRKLKEALRVLVQAESLLGRGEPVSYERFMDELEAVVVASVYRWDGEFGAGGVWAATVQEARGLSFGTVVMLGLSEGEFPRPSAVDVLLREPDRELLAARGLPLELPAPGDEFTLFSEGVTRARERLLLSRPYLSDAGQPWDPSPFWEDTLRLFAGADQDRREQLVMREQATALLPLERAASWPEFLAALGGHLGAGEPEAPPVAAAVAQAPGLGELWQGITQGADVLAARLARTANGPFEGDCAALSPTLAARYGPRQLWSASRLESYRGCPLAFYLGYALGLAPREPAKAGFDAAQLGSIYHEILEKVCRRAAGGSVEDELRILPAVAGEVLERAPEAYGFRPSQLWEQEKARICEDCQNTLRALADASDGWRACELELRFGRRGDTLPAYQVPVEGQGSFGLRGVIDRVDTNAAGELRLIDYKSGSSTISYQDLMEGRRLQLALYAWAAQEAMSAVVTAGFYWHIRAAKRSSLSLERMDGGAAQAMAVAAARAWEAIAGVSAGRFAPDPAGHDCPSYCPGAPFCWRYSPQQRFRG